MRVLRIFTTNLKDWKQYIKTSRDKAVINQLHIRHLISFDLLQPIIINKHLNFLKKFGLFSNSKHIATTLLYFINI